MKGILQKQPLDLVEVLDPLYTNYRAYGSLIRIVGLMSPNWKKVPKKFPNVEGF